MRKTDLFVILLIGNQELKSLPHLKQWRCACPEWWFWTGSPDWSFSFSASAHSQGFSTCCWAPTTMGKKQLTQPFSSFTSWVFWRSIEKHQHFTSASSMHAYLPEQTPLKHQLAPKVSPLLDCTHRTEMADCHLWVLKSSVTFQKKSKEFGLG